MTDEQNLKVTGCRGRGNCGCSQPEPLIDRDPGDQTPDPAGGAIVNPEWAGQIGYWPQEQDFRKLFEKPSIFEGKSDRHPSSQAFVDRIESWVNLHDVKQRDYGSDVDPFANIREGARQLGLPAWIGAVLRMNDKMRRLNTAAKQYIETGQISLANEGVIDSFDDLGVYSGIGATMFEEEAADNRGFA